MIYIGGIYIYIFAAHDIWKNILTHVWNMIYGTWYMSDIYGMVSDILCIYVWTMIYVIFLYGSILLISSICKKLYTYIIYHRPFWLMQIILLLLHILPCQRIILNSMAPPIKKEPVLCHNIAKFAVVKSEEPPKASRHYKKWTKGKTNTHQTKETKGINKNPTK